MNRIRIRILMWLWGNGSDSSGICANRRWWVRRIGQTEWTVTMRHLGGPDGYSREELVQMAKTLREHEGIIGWRVPEPVKED